MRKKEGAKWGDRQHRQNRLTNNPMRLPFTSGRNLCDALPTRFSNALAAAAKLLEPKAQYIKLTGGTIKNEDDLKSWLSTTEQHIREKLKDGPVIL